MALGLSINDEKITTVNSHCEFPLSVNFHFASPSLQIFCLMPDPIPCPLKGKESAV